MFVDKNIQKSSIFVLLCVMTAVLPSFALFAQTAPVRLDWNAENAASRYEILIEQKDTSGIVMEYKLFARETRTVPYIEVSLPEAEYRFKVESYNALDKVEHVSDWQFFRVIKIREPEITTVLPQKINADSSNLKIEIAGNYIHPDAKFYFISGDLKKLLPHSQEITPDGKSATVYFSSTQLSQMMFFGTSELYAENPGKFITKAYSVNFKPPMTVSIGPVAIFDFANENATISPGGFARFQLIPTKIFGTLNIGIEINVAFAALLKPASGELPLHFMANFSPVIQSKLGTERVIGSFRAGIGFFDSFFSVNTGISFDFRFTDLFYASLDMQALILLNPSYVKTLFVSGITFAGFRF